MKALGGRGFTWILIRLAWMVLSLAAPLTLLSIYSITQFSGIAHTISDERASLDDMNRRANVFNAVIAYRETYVLHNGSLRDAERRVDEAIKDADRRALSRPKDSLAGLAWSRLRNSWNAVRRGRNNDRVERAVDDARYALSTATEEIEISDPHNRTVRSLINIEFNSRPVLISQIHRLTDALVLILNDRQINFGERVHGAAQLTLMQNIRTNVIDNLNIASRDSRDYASNTENGASHLNGSLDPYFGKIEQIVTENNANDRYRQRDDLRRQSDQAVRGVDDLIRRSGDEISWIIDGVAAANDRNLLYIRLGLSLTWAFGLLAVVRYADSLRQRARELDEREKLEEARKAESLHRHNTEVALGVQTQMFKAVFERAPVGIATIDAQGDIHQWNPELQRFLSNRKLNLIGEHREEFQALLNKKIPIVAFERSFAGVRDEELWASIVVSRIYDDGSYMALCMVQDITQKRLAEARLRHEATHDGLTGLANRRLFRSQLGHSIERHMGSGNAFAALFIDLDLFKYVNDTFGHPAGDFVLKTVAERLLKLSRPHDVVARFGGDEFAMLMEAPCPSGAGETLADDITTSLAEPIFWEDQQVNIGSSIGLIYGPGEYQNAEDIMRNADTAMYAAKSAGRGRYIVFDPRMQDAAHQRAQLSNDLQSALGDTEQIHVLYQPILSVKDNAIMGFEALARWRHPQFGDIGPDEFVKVAEQSGAIRQLGRTVMRKAFTQLTQAGSRLPDLSRLWLSVNLSPAELSAPDFVESVAAVIRETDFDPSRLYLEITESRVIDSGDQANRILSRLREFGIRVSIDDFGAGYSSLRYLQELDLDLIKIDKGFLKQPNGTDSREEILRAIIALAAAFSLPVCAEGVETAEQLKLVRAIGFQYAQGRIWGEPLSIEEIEARFTVNAS